MRGYQSPISIRNVGNDIDDKTAAVLLDVCSKNKNVFYGYFKAKAKKYWKFKDTIYTHPWRLKKMEKNMHIQKLYTWY